MKDFICGVEIDSQTQELATEYISYENNFISEYLNASHVNCLPLNSIDANYFGGVVAILIIVLPITGYLIGKRNNAQKDKEGMQKCTNKQS